MSPRIEYIQSAWRRGGTRLTAGALLAVAALELAGCTWTEEEWQALANPALCGIAFDCGGNGNGNMGSRTSSTSSDDSSDDSSGGGSGGSSGTGGEAAATGGD